MWIIVGSTHEQVKIADAQVAVKGKFCWVA